MPKKPEFVFSLKKDGTMLRLTIGEVAIGFTAFEVSAVIDQMAACRERMVPPVLLEPPRDEMTTASPVTTTAVSSHPADRLVGLWLRHSGYGWIALSLEPHQARTIASQLLEAAAEVSPPAS